MGYSPDETINLFNSVLNFVISIRRLYAQLKNKSVNLVHDKGDFYALLEGMADDKFRSDH